MSDLPAIEVEPITVEEVEAALRLVYKVAEDAKALPEGQGKAMVVSSLYRAFKALSDDLRGAREFALLNAAVKMTIDEHEAVGQGRDFRFFEPRDPDDHLWLLDDRDLKWRMDILGMRANFPFTWEKGDGTKEIMWPFSSDNEPTKIMRRLLKRIRASLKHERQWEAEQNRERPNPLFAEYRDR